MARRSLLRAAMIAVAAAALAAPAGAQAQSAGSPLAGDGVWIWYVSRSGGTAEAIAEKARTYGIEHVLVKSGDGTDSWEQFTPELVSTLHANGIKVCAWQFVYGRNPGAEAAVGAEAAFEGADCLVIDAESHYEGRYKAADKYMRGLRARVGPNYPLGLSSFPYVHFHPSFPYSVFLGPGGAQFNVPQMYWKTIGTSVSSVYSTTYRYNLPYKRPVYPVGQTYSDPSLGEIDGFRRSAYASGAPGVSWWSWQETSTAEFQTLAAPLAAVSGAGQSARYPRLRRGSRGDLVVLAQQLLRAARVKVKVTGVFDRRTARALRKFKRRSVLGGGGKLGHSTWAKLLLRDPKPVRWSARTRAGAATASAAGGHEPRSADLPAVGYEIPPADGAGAPPP
jgi:hypothetical protein